MRRIDKIILHCSATREGRNYDVEEIRRWHLRRGWSDIGYHYLIHLDGTIETGRPIEKMGAHTVGQNRNSIGICYVGGVEATRNSKGKFKPKDTRTPEQKDSLIVLMHHLIYTYNHNMTIHGHNEYANKACPSFNVQEEYANL